MPMKYLLQIQINLALNNQRGAAGKGGGRMDYLRRLDAAFLAVGFLTGIISGVAIAALLLEK